MPALAAWGAEDRVVSLEVGRILAAGIPGARLEVSPGAGHACYLDRPGRLHELLLAFLHAPPPPAHPPSGR